MKDLKSRLFAFFLSGTGISMMVSQAGDGSLNTPNALDTQGLVGAAFAVLGTILTSGTVTATLIHGNAANGSDSVQVPAEDYTGDVVFTSADITPKTTHRIGYTGAKRFVWVRFTAAGTAGGTWYGAAIGLGERELQP